MSTTMSISIPLDEDGYLLLQCPHCKSFFKVLSEDYKSADVDELWCPICGLKSENFWPDKVIELAKAKVLNSFIGDSEKELARISASTSRQSLITLKVSSTSKREHEAEILPAVDSFVKSECNFCGKSIKVKPLDKYVGSFCAYCGERM